MPIGDISVMPHAWVIGMPSFSLKALIRAGGAADPPTMSPRTVDRSDRVSSRWWSRSSQIVGTPAPKVTFSASIICASGAAWRNRSGMTRLAPVAIAR